MVHADEPGPVPLDAAAPHPTWAGGASAAHVNGLVPFAHVTDIGRSTAFYEALGFTVEHTFEPHGRRVWAWLSSGKAHLMLALGDGPLDRDAQGVLFYLYTDDLGALRERLVAAGIEAGEIVDGRPGPRHEIGLYDPDGYCLMVAQLVEEPPA